MDISVIVPIYNGEKYVEQCCEQLNNQTCKSLEIILINDGSTDKTAEICAAMAAKYEKCHVINQVNKGVSAARNAGLKCATGRYIGFMDVDDEIDDDMFEILIKNADFHQLDILSMEKTGCSDEVTVYENQEEWMRAFFNSKIRIAVWNKIFKKEIFDTVFFLEGKRIHEDLYVVYQALCVAQSVGVINIEKYHYVQWEGSSSRTTVFNEKYFDAIEIADLVYDNAKKLFPTLNDLNEVRKARTYLRISKIYYLRKAPVYYRDRILKMRQYLVSLDKQKMKRHLSKMEYVRYVLYTKALPLFKLMIKIIDKK